MVNRKRFNMLLDKSVNLMKRKIAEKLIEKGKNYVIETGKNYVKRIREGTKDSTMESNSTKVHKLRAGPGRLRGKLKKSQKRVRRVKVKPLKGFALQNAGVSVKFENRFQDIATTANEAQIVGHMTLPAAQTFYNVIRAMLKKIMSEFGVHLSSFMDVAGGYSGWQIQLVFYPDWLTPDSTIPSAVSYTIPAVGDWNGVTQGIANSLLGIGEDLCKVRWLYVRLIDGAGKVPVEMNLEYMYFQIKSKSEFKVQNQTLASDQGSATDTAADQETDVHNVPLQGYCYYVKGNQLIHFRGKKAVPVTGAGLLYFKEEISTNGINSEARPAREYINCVGKSKFTLDPGDIKTSVISHNGMYKWREIIKNCFNRANGSPANEYSDVAFKKFGHSRFMHFDKVIGKTGTRISLAGEVEFSMTTACYTTRNRITELVIGQG